MKTIYLLLIALLATACNSDDPVDPASLLPPITTTGENTFGCLIDGKFFRPRDGRSTINSDNKGLRLLSSEAENIEIHAYDRKSDFTGNLIIHLENFDSQGLGTYVIDVSNSLRGIDGNNNNYMNCRFWSEKTNSYQNYISFDNSGIVEISNLEFEQGIKNIYSGIFYSKLINVQNLNDTIEIKSGRFDIETYTLSNTRFN